ncbi:MAG: hypothetical protein HZB16_00620 [Armatimonadetes bacterium]|nr:hypothetical protein [Armatimonadota bacterium]
MRRLLPMGCFAAAAGCGITAMAQRSPIAAWAYVAVALTGPLLIAAVLSSQRAGRDTGRPRSATGDRLLCTLAVALMLLVPQVGLYHQRTLLVAFWALVLVGAAAQQRRALSDSPRPE